MAAAAAVLFYMRLIRAQRDLFRPAQKGMGEGGPAAAPRLIRRWGLFWLGLALVIAGAFAASGVLSAAAPGLKPLWWVPVGFGFGVLTLSI